MKLSEWKQFVLMALFTLGLYAFLYFPLDYYIQMPGDAMDAREVVTVPSADEDDEGIFMLTVVLGRQANIPSYLWALMQPDHAIYPLEAVIPAQMSDAEYHEVMLRSMAQSQEIAMALALRQYGYLVEERGEGVYIVEVADTCTAKDSIFPGDIIVQIDDVELHFMPELSEALRYRLPGEVVSLVLERGEERLPLSVELSPKESDPAAGAIGVSCLTYNWSMEFPLEIDIHTKDIGGSSAGLMMTLEMMNQLDPEDITAGYRIAGTGTVDLQGNVGEIGGVQQKVIGAIRTKAEYFLVPKENYKDASVVAGDVITLVEVANVADALAFLATLQP